MPRPKSGKPPLVAIAVKLEPEELEQVRRYTDLHHMSISTLVREGLRLRMQHSGALPLIPSEHGDNGNTSYTSNTATQSETGTTTALEDLRAMVQTQTERLDALIQALEQQSNTVIPLPTHAGPEQPAGRTDKRPNYGKVTAAVLGAIQDRERFTSGEIAQAVGLKPTTVWQALQGLVKKGVLRQRGKYGEAVYFKVEHDEV
jgi:hypothetical protein